MKCSTLRERAAGSPASTSQVSLVIVLSELFVIVKFHKFSFVASRFSRRLLRLVCLLLILATLVQSKSILHHMFECWSALAPQQIEKAHWWVPFAANFSKRRKIGALRSETCDDYNTVYPVSLLIEEADKFCLIPRSHAASLLQWLTETFALG